MKQNKHREGGIPAETGKYNLPLTCYKKIEKVFISCVYTLIRNIATVTTQLQLLNLKNHFCTVAFLAIRLCCLYNYLFIWIINPISDYLMIFYLKRPLSLRPFLAQAFSAFKLFLFLLTS